MGFRKNEEKEIHSLLEASIMAAVPSGKFGLLLSGGIDSSLIGKILALKKKKFGCFFAGVSLSQEPKDLAAARMAAEEIGSPFSSNMVSIGELEKELPKIISAISSHDPVRVGVASVVYFAAKLASKEGCKKAFSGLGADELFAGYSRFGASKDADKECLDSFQKMLEVDLPDCAAAASLGGIELLFPYVEKNFAERALQLGSEHKLDKKNGMNKKILRELALHLGLPEWMALRPKRAAQYGSNFDRALEQLAKKNGFKYKSDYLRAVSKIPSADRMHPPSSKYGKDFLPSERGMKLGALVSTGKDSLYSLYLMQKRGYGVPCIISIESKNKDSFMYHTPTIGMAKLQAEAMGKKLVLAKSRGEKEKELADLKGAIALAKKRFGIGGVITGALFSEYQASRIDRICAELGLRHFAPLWHMNQETYLRELVASGFEAIITRVACAGMDGKWLGRKIDSNAVSDLAALEKKFGINVAGEGGEYESLVLDAPIFGKKIVLEKSEKKVRGENTGVLIVESARLASK